MADLLALMDHERINKALLVCWSLGVNIAFEFAESHPDRVAGLLAVAGVPGGTFNAMGGLLRVPRRLRHPLFVAGAKLLSSSGSVMSKAAERIPLNWMTVNLTPSAARPVVQDFTEREVTAYRAERLLDVRATRARLLELR